MKPSQTWGQRRPIKTGAWYVNLALDVPKGSPPAAAVSTPYAVRTNGTSLQIGYGPLRRVVTASSIVDPFYPDLICGFGEHVQGSKRLDKVDELTAALVLETKRGSKTTVHLARGSPYVTFELDRIAHDESFEIASREGLASVAADELDTIKGAALCDAHDKCRGLLGNCCPTNDGVVLDCCGASNSTEPGRRFTITVLGGERWRLYASSEVVLEPIDAASVFGHHQAWRIKGHVRVLRFALVPPQQTVSRRAIDVLDASADVYPVAGNIEWMTAPDDPQTALLDFVWTVKSAEGKTVDAATEGQLITLALRHHVALLAVDNSVERPIEHSDYKCVKGDMWFVKGARWMMREDLTSIEFDAPRPPRPDMLLPMISHIKKDVADIPPQGAVDEYKLAADTGSYGSGKRATKFALLAVAARDAGLDKEARIAAIASADALKPWLDPSSKLLVYDVTYGGVVTRKGLLNIAADFGNGWYNDHHFHYGYMLYAAAVVIDILGPAAAYDALGGQTASFALDSILGDVATPIKSRRSSTQTQGSQTILAAGAKRSSTDNYFPVARHKDFYESHSWASGLFMMQDGKDQESVSEATHCYYGVSLLGAATNNSELRDWGRILLGMEVRAARYYWHVSGQEKYPQPFGSNVIVSIIGGSDLSANTWFGANRLFSILVNAMPFTPVSERYLTPPRYIRWSTSQALAELPSLHDDDNPGLATWRALLLQFVAVSEPDQAFAEIIAASMSNPPLQLDQTQTFGSMLYWVATRPDPSDIDDDYVDYAPTRKPTGPEEKLPQQSPMCANHDKCLKSGLNIGNCCPTDSGIFLWCCHGQA